jgi:hypothetical protein
MDTKDIIYFTTFSVIYSIFIFSEYIVYKIHCDNINSKLLDEYKELLDSTIEDLQGLKSIIHTHQKYFKEIVRTSPYNGEEWKNKILDEILIEKLGNFDHQQYEDISEEENDIDYKTNSELQ